MSIQILQERLNQYQSATWQEEEFALKEILQEIALGGLSRTDFFKKAAFQGGTALRILYRVNRFSEDLDFILQKPNRGFQLQSFTDPLVREFQIFGISTLIKNKTKLGEPVQKIFLTLEPHAALELHHYPKDRRPKKIRIKMEVDTNPPDGGRSETKYHDFPFPFGMTVQDLPSLFAGKNHALLCRVYTKGRDWYDFLWYVARRAAINFTFLSSACEQNGPWKGQALRIDREWYLKEMKKKIASVDWQEAKREVSPFLKQEELSHLEIWSKKFFLDRLEKLRLESSKR